MNRIETIVEIGRPVEEVFPFVTTPGHWPRWHPSSLGVEGATDHSLEVGERVTEHFRVAGQEGRAVWTVREREAPRRWVIDGMAEGGRGATITYSLTPTPEGSNFHRELVLSWPGELPDPLRRAVEAESAEALRRLKALLESGAIETPVGGRP
jgi:uncharacterized protein YndB with AHSA1/START domain